MEGAVNDAVRIRDILSIVRGADRGDGKKLALVKGCESAWRKYEGGEFAEAASMFDELKESDKPRSVLAERCRDLIASSPSNWDTGYQFREK